MKLITWDDITYNQAIALQKAKDIEDEYDQMMAIAQAIYGEDVVTKPVDEFMKLVAQLKFLKQEAEPLYNVNNVTVNGREYYFSCASEKLTAAQYMDFQNYSKMWKKDDTIYPDVKYFSVFFIPIEYKHEYDEKGKKIVKTKVIKHKYNDGYDMLQVFKDLEDFPITILNSASFFFERWLVMSIKNSQHYSTSLIQKTKAPKKMKKRLKKMITNFHNLAYSLISSNSVK